jgi:membrane-bound serine protease (ClpP class)
MNYDILAILLLMVGFALLVAEVFIPSGGMIMILAAVAFIASFWAARQAWYGVNPVAFSIYLGALVLLIPAVLIGAFQVFPRTSFGRRLIGAPTLEEVTPYQQEEQHLSQFVGRIGRTATPLTPGGLVMIDSERLHAISQGLFIERNMPVEILGVRGTRVLVREVTEGEASHPPQTDLTEAPFDEEPRKTEPGDPPLDFGLS